MKAAKLTEESKALHEMYRAGEIDDQTLEDSMTGLALLPPQDTALAVYSKPFGLDPYLDQVKDKIAAFKAAPPSLEKESGRKQYASMARKVSSFKTALDSMGKELVDDLKDVPKKIDAERKRVRELLDSWRDDVRKPLDDWDAEQAAIEAQRVADEAAKALAIQIESDHEIALLMFADYLRKQADAAKEAEQQRIEHETHIAAEAAAQATKDAEEKAEAAIRNAQLAEETAKREKAESEARELKAKADAEIATKLAAEKAERERLQAITDTERRIANEKAQAIADEEKRAKNRSHAAQINNEVLADLMKSGCDEACAKNIIAAIARKQIRHTTINY